MANEDMWRQVVNNLRAGDLPDDGITSPELEAVPPPREKLNEGKQKLFIQKLVTEVYVYSDVDKKVYGQQTFQETYVLGEMTADKFLRLIEKERRKKAKDEES
jgi:hypothetical protein